MLGLERKIVQLVPYQESWKEYYKNESEKIIRALGNVLIRIAHMGSTAIIGMSAKPIIDMMGEVKDIDNCKNAILKLKDIGYEYRENDDVEGRLFFIKCDSENNKTLYHLSLTDSNYGFWKRQSLFVDYMNKHENARKAYMVLKTRLAKKYKNDRGAYVDNKTEFVLQILKKAGYTKNK